MQRISIVHRARTTPLIDECRYAPAQNTEQVTSCNTLHHLTTMAKDVLVVRTSVVSPTTSLLPSTSVMSVPGEMSDFRKSAKLHNDRGR